MWVGLGLDFHSPHWYDYMSSGDWCARCTDYDGIKAKYNLDAPVIVGEVYTGTDSDAAARYRDFYAKGYAGAWSWSLFPERTADKLGIDMTAAAAFAASKADDGPTSATVAPLPATATATPVFTATPTQTATPVTTVTPTQTATPKPSATVPAATPTPTDGGKVLPVTWITSATTSPAMGVRRGSLATITTNVTATGSATALVDMEIYDLNGNKVYQKSWDNRTFTSNLRRRYAATWVVPANLPMGTYIVKVGIFSPGWGTLYHWNENAGVLQVK